MNAIETEARKDEYGCTLFIDTLDDHPQIITDQLGLRASEMIIKGSNRLSPMSKRVIEGEFHETNLWIYKVEKELSGLGIYLNNPLEKMLEIMDGKKDLFVGILKKYPKNHILVLCLFLRCKPLLQIKHCGNQ
jgi:hypothetical protein